MCTAIDSGIVTWDASGSYWPIVFLLSLVTVPEVFAKFFILVSVVANVCSQRIK